MTSPPLMGSFTGHTVLNAKQINVSPLEGDSTFGNRKSTVKSEKSPAKAVVDAQAESRLKDQKIMEIVERESIGNKSADSMVLEVDEAGE